jgi:oxygen-independent coproporphyrinogen III oxidase
MIPLIQQHTQLAGDWRAASAPARHLYIHIPFCHRRCSYCDFNTYANMEDRMEAYVDALCAELALLRPEDEEKRRKGDKEIERLSPFLPFSSALTRASLRPTIFLGGGTPSMRRVGSCKL